MEVITLFKDALKYPMKGWNKLLILGVLILISRVDKVIISFGIHINSISTLLAVTIIFGLIALIMSFFLSGYSLSIIKKTINLENDMPEFEWVKNLVDGIKRFVLNIVYLIIPFIITFILAYVTGTLGFLIQIVNNYLTSGLTTTLQSILNSAPNFPIVLLVGEILFIIFFLLLYIATARLAETDSLVEAINMINVIKKIGEIGWGNYIIWLIVIVIIGFVIMIIMNIVRIIPFIGIIIGFLLISPYMLMFYSRTLGLLYNESK
ncbi:MAG: DUF4013 domain-containing protein [Methanobacteriaceae archaeon]|jgi:hypothetical protein|nr:DUF4013 domain-containing protein [Candidatus Methanorudis spinitermitis]